MKACPTIDPSLAERARKIMNPLILASGSANRLAFLQDCGLTVKVAKQDVDETYDGSLSGEEIVAHISSIKMDSYLNSKDFDADTLAISLDTMVSFEGKLLGKPKDRQEACKMLSSFSAHKQRVVTGYCIYRPGLGVIRGSEHSDVVFRSLTEAEIQAYLETGEYIGAAGGYRIQKTGYTLIERIEGSWANVIGFPLEAILEELS